MSFKRNKDLEEARRAYYTMGLPKMSDSEYEELENMSKKETNPKDALGIKKPSLTTIPFPVLYEVGTAMLEGACKYRRHNYRVAGVRTSVYIEAAFRHLCAYWEGEDIDPDSGLSHISKAIASLVVLRDAQMNDMAQDDRPPSPPADWMQKIQGHVDEVLARYPNPLPPYLRKDAEEPGCFDGIEDEEPPVKHPVCDHANGKCIHYPDGTYGEAGK